MILCQTYKGTTCYVCGQKVIGPYFNLSHSFVTYPYIQRSSRIHVVISEMKGKWLHNCQASISRANRWCFTVSRCFLATFLFTFTFGARESGYWHSIECQHFAPVFLSFLWLHFCCVMACHLNWLLQPCSMYVCTEWNLYRGHH